MKKRTEKMLVLIIILFVLLAFFISFWVILYFQDFERPGFKLGVNFSKSYTEYLGLDWKKAYIDILDDLKIKNVRLSAPWNEIEPSPNQWNFSDLDWQVAEASKRDIDIVMVLGRRTPHWPECHDPQWIKALPQPILSDDQLAMMKEIINRYKNNEHIKIWQVENEPLLNLFGVCPPSDLDFLRKEIAFVKTLDSRPVLITDSGELSLWLVAAKLGDLFGTTLYRVTYNPWFGYAYYHLPPAFYRFKSWLVSRSVDEVFVAELQAEPWAPGGILNLPLEEQALSMDAERLRNHVNYVKRTGFAGAYLWGAEWWLWLKDKKNDSTLWEEAKSIFSEK